MLNSVPTMKSDFNMIITSLRRRQLAGKLYVYLFMDEWMECVCLYICKHICNYVWMDGWMDICIVVLLLGCIYVIMYVWLYVSMHVCIRVWLYVCTYIHMYTYICMIFIFIYHCVCHQYDGDLYLQL